MRKNDKNNCSILKKKTHAYLQAIVKALVKFRKNQSNTLGGVARTRYLLEIRSNASRTMDSQKQCPFACLRKGDGQKMQ